MSDDKLKTIHDYVAFSFIHETNPNHWKDVSNMKRLYENIQDPAPEEGLAVIGRDGTGVLYQLSHGSKLSYEILSGTERILVEGRVAAVTNLPRGQIH